MSGLGDDTQVSGVEGAREYIIEFWRELAGEKKAQPGVYKGDKARGERMTGIEGEFMFGWQRVDDLVRVYRSSRA